MPKSRCSLVGGIHGPVYGNVVGRGWVGHPRVPDELRLACEGPSQHATEHAVDIFPCFPRPPRAFGRPGVPTSRSPDVQESRRPGVPTSRSPNVQESQRRNVQFSGRPELRRSRLWAMIISLAGQKGGSGKSTIAVHLASEWHRRGQRVLLVDADPQATALTWSEVASEHGHGGPDTIALGDNLRTALPGVAEGYDMVVIDCPGRKASKRQVGALIVSDVALLPSGPSTPDVWALAESVEVVEQVRELRPDLRVGIVVNRRTPTNEGRTAREAFSVMPYPVLEVELGQRVAFSEALAAGLGVTAYAGGSAAAVELRRLVDNIEDFGAEVEVNVA